VCHFFCAPHACFLMHLQPVDVLHSWLFVLARAHVSTYGWMVDEIPSIARTIMKKASVWPLRLMKEEVSPLKFFCGCKRRECSLRPLPKKVLNRHPPPGEGEEGGGGGGETMCKRIPCVWPFPFNLGYCKRTPPFHQLPFQAVDFPFCMFVLFVLI
jgi:hypothetical protein